MIPFIQQALTMGYTAAQVLNYVSRKFKSAIPGISNARQQGYSDEDILKFLGGKIKPKNKKAADQQLSDQEKYLKAVGIKTRGEKEEARNKFISGALNLGLTGLGAYNMYQGYKGLGQTFGLGGTATQPPIPGTPPNPPPAAPQSPGQLATPQTPMPQGVTPGQAIQMGVQNPINQALNAPGSQQIAQAASAIPGQENAPKQSLFEQLTQGIDLASLDPSTQQQLQFLSMISDQLESKGKTLADPEFKKVSDKIKKVLQGKSGVLMQEASRGITTKEQEIPKISPQSIVSTPQGIGEVKGISNGQAIVEIDGKAHKVDEKEIEPPPIPEKDLADLHNDLIAGIEKETGRQVSRHVDWAGYDPEANELLYKPWGGESYTYTDIEPEDVKILTDFLTQRKTTGENWIGGWEAGTESPIGAAMHNLIQKLKAKAKEKGVKEYSRKYQTVYSAREPAEKAAKLKKKLAEQEERKKKKNEKKAKK